MALIKKYNQGGNLNDSFDKHLRQQFLEGKFEGKEAEDVRKFLNDGTISSSIKTLRENYKPATKIVTVNPKRGKEPGNFWDWFVENRFGGKEEAFIDYWEKLDNPQREETFIKGAQEFTSEYLKDSSEDKVGHTWGNLEDIKNIANIIAGDDPDKMKHLTDITNRLGWDIGRWFISPEELERRKQAEETKQAETEAITKRENLSTALQNIGLNKEIATTLANAGVTISEDYEPFTTVNFMTDYAKQKGISVLKYPDGTVRFIKDGQPYSNFGGFISEDPFSEHYGKTFSATDEGLRLYQPNELSTNPFINTEYKDPGNLRRELLFNNSDFEGFKYYGTSEDDFRGKFNKDLLGRRDFLKRIERIGPDGISTILTRTDQGYVDKTGNIVNIPSFTSYGESTIIEEPVISALFENPSSLLYGVKPFNVGKAGSSGSIENLEKRLDKLKAKPIPGETFEFGTAVKNESRKVASLARWFLENGNDNQKERALKILNDLVQLSGEYSTKDDKGNIINTGFLKKGGIIKSQQGITTSDLIALNKKYVRATKPTEEKEEDKPKEKPIIRDISGTVKDEWEQFKANPLSLKTLSGLGVAASFIPGVGLIGGLVTTGSDIVRGFTEGNKEWDSEDWKRLGGNLAFTALAGVGLGGARVLKGASKLGAVATKSGKAAKTVNTVKVIEKAASKAEKMGKFVDKAPTSRLTSLTKKLGETATKELNQAFKGTLPATTYKASKETVWKASPEFIKKAKEVYKVTDESTTALQSLANQISKDLKYAADINATTTSALSSYSQRAVQPVKNFGKWVTQVLPTAVPQAARYGIGAANVFSAGTGALEVASSIAKEGNLKKGLEYSGAAAMQRLALGLAGTRGVLKNKRNVRQLQKYGERVTSNKITIGDKSYDTTEFIKPRKAYKGWFSSEAKNLEKNAEYFKSALEGKVIATDKQSSSQLIEEIIKGIKENKSLQSTPASGWRIPDKLDLGGDYYKMNQIRERLSHIVATGKYNFMNPGYGYFKGFRFEKGGKIIKGQQGLSTDFNNKYSNIGEYKNKALKDGTLPYSLTKGLNLNWQLDKNNQSGYSKLYENLISKVDDNFYNQHIGNITDFVNKQGGKYIPKNAADLRRLMSDGKYGPIHNWFLSRFAPITSDTRNVPQSTVQQSPTISNFMSTLKGEGSSTQGIIKDPRISTPKPGEIQVEGYNLVDPKYKKYTGDIIPMTTEFMKWGASKQANAKILQHMLAAAGRVPTLSNMPHYYDKTSQINRVLAEDQVSNLHSIARRIGETSSDLDYSARVKLEAAKEAGNILMQGAYRDFETNQKIAENQRNRNYQVDQFNLQQGDKRSALINDALQKMDLARVNKLAADYGSDSNLLSLIGKIAAERPYKEAMNKYSQMQNNPNIATLQDQMRYWQGEGLEKFKKQFESDNKWDKKNYKFEDSDYYKQWKKEYDKIIWDLNSLNRGIQNQGNIAMGYQYLLQKGGRIPLSEKITLENLKYNNKRKLQKEEHFLKAILENTKMYNRAFIKVFK